MFQGSSDKYSPKPKIPQNFLYFITNLISVLTNVPFLSKTKPNKLFIFKNKQGNAYHMPGPSLVGIM